MLARRRRQDFQQFHAPSVLIFRFRNRSLVTHQAIEHSNNLRQVYWRYQPRKIFAFSIFDFVTSFESLVKQLNPLRIKLQWNYQRITKRDENRIPVIITSPSRSRNFIKLSVKFSTQKRNFSRLDSSSNPENRYFSGGAGAGTTKGGEKGREAVRAKCSWTWRQQSKCGDTSIQGRQKVRPHH